MSKPLTPEEIQKLPIGDYIWIVEVGKKSEAFITGLMSNIRQKR